MSCPDRTECCGAGCCATGECCNGACCAAGQVCCGGNTCCDPTLCCANGVCCGTVCNECVTNGALSGGVIDVTPDPACLGDAITFTLTGVVDSGGTKRENCVQVSIPGVMPSYTWDLTVPPDYPPPLPPLTGSGSVVTVVAKMAGTYAVTFTATGSRECAPPLHIVAETGKGVKAVITNAKNTQAVRGTTLDDQVLAGTNANLQVELDLDLQGETYFLRWTFVGTPSLWQGPYAASPSGTLTAPIAAGQAHTLGEQLGVEVRVGMTGPICSTFTRNMKVFFDVDAANDTHNHPSGNTDANWFRHWGIDQDGACSTFAATASVLYFGAGVSFVHGGIGNPDRASYNGNVNSPIFTLYNYAHARENPNFSSAAMTYTDSQGNQVNAPAGAIMISFDVSGIDAVDLDVTHEAEHLHTDVRWDPLGGDWFAAYGLHSQVCDDGDGILEPGEHDFDCDELPNVVEDATPGFRWDRSVTHSGFYLTGDDEEVWIENIVQQTAPGTGSNDWAFEGKQSNPAN